jgi:hypothetical protein
MVRMGGMGGDGVVFTSNGTETKESGTNLAATGGRKGRNKYHITSFKCHEKGCYTDACPNNATKDDNNEAVNLLIARVESREFEEFMFAQRQNNINNHGKHNKIKETWVLFDNQSTVDVFCNRSYYPTFARRRGVWLSIVAPVRQQPTWSASLTGMAQCGITQKGLLTYCHWRR